MTEIVRAHVHVSGSVQGVFFRQEALRRAGSKSLSGWVRNLPDGRVEAVFQGERASVQSMVDWCRNGPPLARVDDVNVEWEGIEEGAKGFSIK